MLNLIEVTELIATRIPPGDQWKLVEEDTLFPSLLEMISAYQRKTSHRGAYRFEPLEGKFYVIKVKQQKEVLPSYLDIYGEKG